MIPLKFCFQELRLQEKQQVLQRGLLKVRAPWTLSIMEVFSPPAMGSWAMLSEGMASRDSCRNRIARVFGVVASYRNLSDVTGVRC